MDCQVQIGHGKNDYCEQPAVVRIKGCLVCDTHRRMIEAERTRNTIVDELTFMRELEQDVQRLHYYDMSKNANAQVEALKAKINRRIVELMEGESDE